MTTADGFPRPPADFAAATLPRHELPKGTVLWRVHATGMKPLWFGPRKPPQYRFDDRNEKFGTCYLGETHYAAFVETFFRSLPTRAVSLAQLHARAISQCTLGRKVSLAALFGPGLVKLGATASVTGARGGAGSYAHSQEWSRALFDHPDAVDGIAYRSSHDDSLLCVALFGRAEKALSVSGTSGPLDGEAAMVADIARRYRVAIL